MQPRQLSPSMSKRPQFTKREPSPDWSDTHRPWSYGWRGSARKVDPSRLPVVTVLTVFPSLCWTFSAAAILRGHDVMGGIGPEEEARLRVLFDEWHGDAPPPARVYEIMRELFDKWHIEAHQDTDHDHRPSE